MPLLSIRLVRLSGIIELVAHDLRATRPPPKDDSGISDWEKCNTFTPKLPAATFKDAGKIPPFLSMRVLVIAVDRSAKLVPGALCGERNRQALGRSQPIAHPEIVLAADAAGLR